MVGFKSTLRNGVLAVGVISLAGGAFSTTAFAQSDASKIDRPDEVAAEEKKESEKPAPVIQPQGGDANIDQLLDDVQKNMKRIEELLKDKDTSSSTQEVQRMTLDQLDKLIEEAGKT